MSAFLTSFWEYKKLLEDENLLVEKEELVDKKVRYLKGTVF